MAAGAGGEAVVVFFKLDEGGGNIADAEAIMPARQWAKIPDANTMSNRQWWLSATKTPWVNNTDLAPQDGPYDEGGACIRFGAKVDWQGQASMINDAVANVLRAGEFDLPSAGQDARNNNVTIGVFRSGEYTQIVKAAVDQALSDAGLTK
jgi:hypothetical protein